MEKKTAIIIGAGPAGLTAAYELLKKSDIHPIILEESHAIGGISQTVDYKGNRIDIGGHRFFSKIKAVTDLWEEILPTQGAPSIDDKILSREKPLVEGGPDPEKTDEVMLIRTRVSRIYYLRKFFDYPVSMKAQTFKNMGFRRTIKSGFGYMGSAIFKRKEKNLEDFMINRFGKPLYGMFFEKYTEKVWGRHPRDIDASWGAQRIKGLSLFKALGNILAKPFRKKNAKVETSLIEQYAYPKKGPGQLYETMAKRIVEMGGTLILDAKVDHIGFDGKAITFVEATTPEGKKSFVGDYYFSSMPLKDHFLSIGEASIDSEAYRIATSLIYRDFITVGLLLKKLKIQNQTKMKTLNNLVPDCWIYIQEEEVKLGRLQLFNNWSPYMPKDPLNTVWVGLEYFVNEGDELWTMPEKDFIAFAIHELALTGIIDANDVLDSVEIKIKKAYPAYFESYKEIDKVIAVLKTIDNLYCIGRNGQHRYNNMDHSIMTAMEAVKVILNPESSDKSLIWKVNTEKEYHEKADAKKAQ